MNADGRIDRSVPKQCGTSAERLRRFASDLHPEIRTKLNMISCEGREKKDAEEQAQRGGDYGRAAATGRGA